jgi:hypothetical protein
MKEMKKGNDTPCCSFLHFLLDPEDGDRTFSWNPGRLLSNYMRNIPEARILQVSSFLTTL